MSRAPTSATHPSPPAAARVGDGAALLERGAERAELRLQIADADAEDQPAVREPVEAGQLLGQHERVALRQDDDAGAETHAARYRGTVGQRDHRIEDRLVWR